MKLSELSKSLEDLRVLDANLMLLRQRFSKVENSLVQLNLDLAKAQNSYSLYKLSKEFYVRAVDIVYERSIGEIENVINSALSFVFFDKIYKVKLELDFTRGKKSVRIVLFDCSKPEDPIEVDMKDGVGQGVRTLVSFVLHSYYIISRGAYPVLFLDESYSYLSEQYVDRFFEFVKGLCNSKGFHVVLVTHDNRFWNYADKRYNVVDGVVKEIK